MQSLAVTNVAQQMTETPFLAAFNVVVINNSAGSLVLQGSDDGVTYTTLATLAAAGSNGSVQTVTLPNYIKVSTAAYLFLLGSLA